MSDLLTAEQCAEILGYSANTWKYRLSYLPEAPKPVQRARNCKRFWIREDIVALRDKWAGR